MCVYIYMVHGCWYSVVGVLLQPQTGDATAGKAREMKDKSKRAAGKKGREIAIVIKTSE